jgi:hypothetical protein
MLAVSLNNEVATYLTAKNETTKRQIEVGSYLLIFNYWVGTRKLGSERNDLCEQSFAALLAELKNSEFFREYVTSPDSLYGPDGNFTGGVVQTPFNQRTEGDILDLELKSEEEFNKMNKEFIEFIRRLGGEGFRSGPGRSSAQEGTDE